MSYATPDDMCRQFGERECIALCDPHLTGEVDLDHMTAALERASAEIDAWLGAYYPLPLAEPLPALTGRCCDICRWQLCTAEHPMTEEIRMRYEDAIHWLEKVAEGKIRLGRLPDGAVPAPSARMKFRSSPRQFSRDKSRGGAF